MKGEVTEAQFLKAEAARAQRAIRRTVLLIGKDLGQAVDVRTWIQQYPWISTGSGALLGFLAAARLTPTREESFKEKWSELVGEIRRKRRRRRVSRRRRERQASHDGGASAGTAEARKTSWLSLIPTVLKAIQKASALAGPP